MKTYLQSRVIRMDKRENLLQFLDYGGNELFSSLMESDSDRPQALDRMCILLRTAVILVVLIYNYMHSEKYLKRMYQAAEETVIIESAYKTDYGIKLTIHNNSLADYYICDLPTLKYTDEYDDRAIGTYYHCKNAKL